MVELPMTASTTATNPTDAAFEVLAHRQRRTILRHLVDTDGPATVDQLAETIIAEDGPRPNRGDVRLQLHHVHLPKLRRAEVVAYDTPDDPISFVGHEWIEELLRGCR